MARFVPLRDTVGRGGARLLAAIVRGAVGPARAFVVAAAAAAACGARATYAAGVGAAADGFVQQLRPDSAFAQTWRTLCALAVVLALVVCCGLIAKRYLRGNAVIAAGSGKASAVEVLDRTPLNAGARLVVVRFGARVVLLSQSSTGPRGGQQVTVLSEIVEPGEVERFLGVVRGASDAGVVVHHAARGGAREAWRSDRGGGAARARHADHAREGSPA